MTNESAQKKYTETETGGGGVGSGGVGDGGWGVIGGKLEVGGVGRGVGHRR